MSYSYKKIVNYNHLPFHLIIYNENSNPDLELCPKHWHEHLEIVVTIHGKGKVWNEGKEYKIRDNNVFIINPKSLHQVKGYPPYSQNIGYCLQIDLSYFFSFFPSLNKNYHVSCSDEISKLILKEVTLLHQDIKKNEDDFTLFIRIVKILKILNGQMSFHDSSIKSERYKNKLLNILKYIQEHYDESLMINDIANHFDLSPSYLHKLFKEYFQQPIHQYITEIRMIHALDDLKYSDLNILDISLKNGFASNKSFTNEFKKRFHMTPITYRNQQK